MNGLDRSLDARLARHIAAARALESYTDQALTDLLEAAHPLGAGIGGQSALLHIAGNPVFVKRTPLTDLERQPDNIRSTANLFELPGFCNFGVGAIGAPGFGAWRELAIHDMTTAWVLAGEAQCFPLMHHWRVLPGSTPLPEELADIEQSVVYWGGRAEMRHRIEGLRDALANVTVFLEHIPQNLHEWLGTQIELGGDAADRACLMVEGQLDAGVSFMNGRGLLHFDTHFENVLTDGERLYFADFGLAIASAFEMSGSEADFFERHQTYDRSYYSTYLVDWLLTALSGLKREDQEARFELVGAIAAGKRLEGVSDEIAALLIRHAPIAAVISEFTRAFQRQSREIPYPVEAIRRLYLRASEGP